MTEQQSQPVEESDYVKEIRRWGDPDQRSPQYVSNWVRRHCDEAAKRFAQDPDRIPERTRYFLVCADHYWHGYVQELVQVNASRERIQEVFEECRPYKGIELTLCEELIRFKLVGPEEREGMQALVGFARDEGLAENYAVDRAVNMLERCMQGYDV